MTVVVVLVVIVGALLAVLALGSLLSLDRDRHHSAATAALPLLDANTVRDSSRGGTLYASARMASNFARVSPDSTTPGLVSCCCTVSRKRPRCGCR